MIDPDTFAEERRAARDADTEPLRQVVEPWRYGYVAQLRRRWLALHRAERWSFAAIACLDGVSEAEVRQAVVDLLELEARP